MDTPLVVLIVLTSVAVTSPLYEMIFGKKSLKYVQYLTILSLLVSLILLISSTLSLTPQESTVPHLLRNDTLGSFFSFIVILVTLFVSITSFDYMKGNPNERVYYSLLLFTAIGMTMLCFAVDLLVIFVAFELMSLPTFILAGYNKQDKLSNEAAVKFFILGALSSGILLYGISIMFGITGSTNLEVISQSLTSLSPDMLPFVIFSTVSMLAGLGLKLSIVPFHMWIPDTYEGSPTTVSTLLSAATKKAGFASAIRIFAVIFPLFYFDLSLALAIIALVTMTLGNLAALTQKSITRMLAYSSIAQAGYLLIGIVVLPYTNLGLIGLLYHSFNHAILQATAFLAAGLVRLKTSSSSLDSYNGLSKVMPITSFCLALSLLGLAGIPPLNGFWSKLILFSAAVDGGYAWLALAGLVNTAISVAYYLLVIKRMYMDETSIKAIKEPLIFISVLVFATAIIIVTGLLPNVLYDIAEDITISFLANNPV
ncbi:MAG: NADH-quinone oxidoreductase subunit N [Thaumarchaeota archaeon]|nr:NADH-quinone oxidoreductase subunit N [Nitrososphaerota archaeon]NSL76994.1 NADH-quinone oxidoreductase subunit N [Nitrososphaerota archaeon]